MKTTEVQEESCGDTELRGQEESSETLAGAAVQEESPDTEPAEKRRLPLPGCP